ncbi:hypothetical protein WMY93_027192 [Mugilogobius chulae]|uniref:Alpha-1,3-mannosyl-glycoprotein 4-beta-N-acetylglucosaminyltransferase C-like n=1 Tax=Mugilogobius chulae TaxID=88201 RepID=A0AAW0MZ13_9GOBI
MARLWKRRALTAVAFLLMLWICVSSLHIFYNDSPESNAQVQWLIGKVTQGEWSGPLPLNVSYQLLSGTQLTEQKFLAIGISSVKRKKDMYLKATLESLFSQSSEQELEQMVVVVLIADFDENWRQFVAEEIQKSFPTQLERGQLLLIHVQQEYYPPLTGLKRNYNDPSDRVSFRSKQNVDYSFLIHFCSTLGRYYLQLEDDVYSAKNFLTKIRKRISEQNAKKSTWATLEFSTLGYIGKLYKSIDLPVLSRFLFLFYQEMPCDWLLSRFRDLLTQKEPIVFRPSLFQHMGTFSSFRGIHNKLKDKDFDDGYANLDAEVFTSMSVYQKHYAHLAWTSSEEFFWARSPVSGDYFTAVLKKPAILTEIFVETGDGGKDVLISAEVELGKDVVSVGKQEKTCKEFVSVGKIQKGKFELQELEKSHGFSSSCVRIRVTATQTDWAIIKRIRVAEKQDTSTKL